MRYLLLTSLVLLAFTAQAQFGLTGSYLTAQADDWTSQTEVNGEPLVELPGSGWQLGADYWFRLKNKRIEFMPTLAVGQQDQTIGLSGTSLETQIRSYSFFFNTNFYLLDFTGDCDCPTFSKQGPALQKGIFIQLSPGISSWQYTLEDQLTQLTNSEVVFSAGAAVGIDIGIADLLTISPYAGLRYFPGATWDSFNGDAQEAFNLPADLKPQTDVVQYHLGVRLGFRFDQ